MRFSQLTDRVAGEGAAAWDLHVEALTQKRADRIKTGLDALVHSALAGKGAMAPQGGGDFNDTEIARAAAYMANAAGAKFEEPAAPAAAGASEAEAAK